MSSSPFTTLQRYARAFVTALRLTLRGEKPALLQVNETHPQLAAWWTQTLALVQAVEQTADANGLDAAGRKAFRLTVDKRSMSMETILATVRYHAEREYPYLFAHGDPHDRTALFALNLNDRYFVLKLTESAPEALKPTLEALSKHLEALPSS